MTARWLNRRAAAATAKRKAGRSEAAVRSTVTLTITGAAHLHEFTSLLKAVRRSSAEAARVACGRRIASPMNQSLPYVLPADARAVYVFGKSAAGPAEDVHAVLVPEPGASAVVLLTRDGRETWRWSGARLLKRRVDVRGPRCR